MTKTQIAESQIIKLKIKTILYIMILPVLIKQQSFRAVNTGNKTL